MPNWSEGTMDLVLPTEYVDLFLSYFKYDENGRFFHRTLLLSEDSRDNPRGLTLLNLVIECAWSANGCIIDTKCLQDDRCISLEDAIKECHVKRLDAKLEEPGIGFGELIYYSPSFGLCYESYDIPNTHGYIELDDDEGIDDEVEE